MAKGISIHVGERRTTETWVLHDRQLIDDELARLYAELRGRRPPLRPLRQLPQRHGTRDAMYSAH